jgi:hypothetical protein
MSGLAVGSRSRPPAAMPDRHGFNLLGDSARCIDCPAGGPIWRWPERKRSRHARTHQTQSSTGLRRRRNLLAAPPTDTSEEKEAITMAHHAPSKGGPAKQVAIDVLRQAGEPLHAKEIAKRVLASGRCTSLKGKTPRPRSRPCSPSAPNPAAPSPASTKAPTRSQTHPPQRRSRHRQRGEAGASAEDPARAKRQAGKPPQ